MKGLRYYVSFSPHQYHDMHCRYQWNPLGSFRIDKMDTDLSLDIELLKWINKEKMSSSNGWQCCCRIMCVTHKLSDVNTLYRHFNPTCTSIMMPTFLLFNSIYQLICYYPCDWAQMLQKWINVVQNQRISSINFNVFKFTPLVRANDAFINLVVRNDYDDGDMETFTLRCIY